MKSFLLSVFTFVLAGSMSLVAAAKIDVQILRHSWKPTEQNWELIGKSQFEWSAVVKNESSDPRKICVTYELLGPEDQVVASSNRCQVVSAGQEGEITGTAYVDSRVLADAKNSRATPAESHMLHSFVPKP